MDVLGNIGMKMITIEKDRRRRMDIYCRGGKERPLKVTFKVKEESWEVLRVYLQANRQ